MKSLEIICCLFVVIFALAVAHPLPDNVLEQVEAKETGGGILAPEPIQTQVLPSSKLDPTVAALILEDPKASALVLKDPSEATPILKDPTAPALILEDPKASAPVLKDPSEATPILKDPTAPAFLFEDPTVAALVLKDPSEATPLLKDPTAAADLQKLPAGGTTPSSDMSQDHLQEQQDSEAIMLSEEALEAILNDEAQESKLQKEE